MNIVFVSGHLDLTPDEFAQHYSPRLQEAIDAGHSFVVGDARGGDVMAQEYLFAHMTALDYQARVTVYHMFKTPRNRIGSCKTRGGYQTNGDKDRALTANSDSDVAWVRPDKVYGVSKRMSGTESNLRRRKALERSK